MGLRYCDPLTRSVRSTVDRNSSWMNKPFGPASGSWARVFLRDPVGAEHGYVRTPTSLPRG